MSTNQSRSTLNTSLLTATAIGAVLALSSCLKEGQGSKKNPTEPVSEPPSTPSTEATTKAGSLNLVTGGAKSAHFDAVASRLQLGGEMFGYMDVDGDMEKLAATIRKFLDSAPAGELPEHIENLDLAKVLSELGLDGIEAVGMSSHKNGEGYHNRAFLYLPEGRKGLMKAMGGDAVPFVSTTLAPGDADLVMEQTLNVRAVYDVVSAMVMRFGGADASEQFQSEMGEVQPQFGLSIAEVLGKLDTRLTAIARVHPDKPLEIPDAPVEFPSFDFLIALDNIDWLYEKVTAKMKAEMPEEQAAEMFVTGDGFEKIALPPMPSPEMVVMQPVIYMDLKTKRLLVASTEAFLNECLAGKTRLADSADFRLATSELPEQGNGLSYVSSRFMETARKLFEAGMQSPGMRMGAQETAIISMLSGVFPEGGSGQAEMMVNEKDGILMVSNASGSMKTGVAMSAGLMAFGTAALSYKRSSLESRSFEVPTEELRPNPVPAPAPVAPPAVPAPPRVPESLQPE